MSQGTSPLPKDKGHTTEPGKAVGIKRLQTDTPSSSGYHNVYVRRKVESEHSKVNPSQELKGNGRDKAKDQEAHQDVQHEEANRPQVASPVAESVELVSPKSSEKPNAEIVPEKTEPPVASGNGIQEDVKQSSIQYWNERFNRLQTYLENCDNSTQEGYLRKLRSLSAAGRSMHAIELEKRAIHLLVEEGKELQRMKALNVLGKVSPNASSKPTPLQRQSQK
ncbi:hypothetical protein BAE44_0011865 [Dichanthelium oligosanthes]|uniref:Uncharacterized protein n=1 Tax=Dichanthelium oligosanthes TaxID=888268 RepID=A0A1E5VPV7_9POAL|nr:hypothetical protein BAE44_0011865 [Dichanthelium oligosanthes]